MRSVTARVKVSAAGEVKDDHWYDVQTKFDLAKAYQEMGDKEGALFDLDKEDELTRVAPTVLALAKDPVAAKAKAAKARAFVEQRQRDMTLTLKRSLPA